MKTVLVCQNRTCLKQGAVEVLAAFHAHADASFVAVSSQCLGQCGNGVMVRVLPEDVWYWRVSPEEVSAIARRHLIGGQAIAAMLYPVFHR
jgi:(2Fe-2S) ferredoxin